ncbi:preprotein translocase subunit SecA [Pseudonocardia broussonetiae]|uniref:Protein translocase subunit SecA n=1 Tax=Pseudonocardia broussonetiae TaxID=2736640 RepID=A0A6M6JIK6_9PSEU|nr:preprotein translocase subunit SecA [Pseudonocardia broussonetiae]QJY46747.1 preprotein translocase subunit SecA [Pseudonocardia broussonetiae]
MPLLDRLLRAGETKLVKRLGRIAAHIDTLEADVEGLTDAELRAKTDEFRSRYADGETLDEMLPEAFSVVREAARRTIGQRPFTVQLMGGAALHLGNIAEMKTGEGKTLTSTLPAYLNAISGEGVHLVTVNDYLAKRDAENMGRIHRFLGLSVGVILSEMPPLIRRGQYQADITYGTNNEFGFDYLRDNMAWNKADMVQRGHNFAVVDEADSILIDEARTPLIISGPAEQSARWYQEFARMAPMLKRDVHYEVDERKRTVGVTEEGVALVEDQLGIDNLYEAANTPLVGYLNNAIKVKELFKKDKDYIVRDGQVLIVDEFTGRVLAGRRYNEGMHQAIEAKEGVEVKAENQTLATITLQNYFRLYERLSGMTGTAQTEAAELNQIYKLGVVPIPTNKDMIRKDQPDLIYKTEEAKFEAVADDIAEKHAAGQPVLVGTTSVEKSEYLSKLLVKRQVPHEVLNAKQHEREAAIVAQAGHAGAVTVATNMAGRGTDIVLGGNPEFLADLELRRRGLDPVEKREEYEAAWDETVAAMKAQVAAEAEEVKAAGGLYVLGTERHESRRIDNQLRGRSGRQGDAGESRFYLSLGDDLMRRFNGHMVESIMNRFNLPDDVPIEAGMVTKAIRSAQTQVEQQNFEIRKNVLKYDEVLNQQRTVIYSERRRVLAGENIQEQIEHMLTDVVTAYVEGETGQGYSEDWDLDKLWTALGTIYPIGIRWQDLADSDDEGDLDDPGDLTKDRLLTAVLEDARGAYARREAEIDAIIGAQGGMRELERQVLLQVIDRKWREHLYEMDYLKEGIGLRAMAQRDPVIEYQREGYDMFSAMLEGIKEETVGHLFNVKVQAPAPPAAAPVDGAAPAAAAAPAAVPAAAVPAAAAPATAAPAPAAAPPAQAAPAAPAAPAAAPAASSARPSGRRRRPEPAVSAPSDDAATTSVLPTAYQGARPADLRYSGPTEDGGTATSGGGGRTARGAARSESEPSRNRPCPCGSGRKYKQCHGSATAARP